ncbi:MAG: hypothetical protein WCD69_17925, partial [Xanthobacteraceae bacterium]
MVDSLGFRLKLGIIAPSTNTSAQPEMDASAFGAKADEMAASSVPTRYYLSASTRRSPARRSEELTARSRDMAHQ